MKEPIEKTRQKAGWGCKKSQAILLKQTNERNKKCDFNRKIRKVKKFISAFLCGVVLPTVWAGLIVLIWLGLATELVKALK